MRHRVCPLSYSNPTTLKTAQQTSNIFVCRTMCHLHTECITCTPLFGKEYHGGRESSSSRPISKRGREEKSPLPNLLCRLWQPWGGVQKEGWGHPSPLLPAPQNSRYVAAKGTPFESHGLCV